MFNETFCITFNLRPHGSHGEFQLFFHQFLQRLIYSFCFGKKCNSITEDVQRDLTISSTICTFDFFTLESHSKG